MSRIHYVKLSKDEMVNIGLALNNYMNTVLKKNGIRQLEYKKLENKFFNEVFGHKLKSNYGEFRREVK